MNTSFWMRAECRGEATIMMQLQRKSLTSQSEGSASPQKSSPRCTFEQSQGLGCCLSPLSCQTVQREKQERKMSRNQDSRTLFTKQSHVLLWSPCTLSLYLLRISQTLAYYICIHFTFTPCEGLINGCAFTHCRCAKEVKGSQTILLPWSSLLSHINYRKITLSSTPQWAKDKERWGKCGERDRKNIMGGPGEKGSRRKKKRFKTARGGSRGREGGRAWTEKEGGRMGVGKE